MLVLEIIGVIVAILVIVGVLYWFNVHCEEKFSHRFLSKAAFWIMAATMTVLFVGYRWRSYAETSGGDTLNGTILIAIGCLMVLGLAFYNYKRSNIIYSVIGTTLQVCLFGALAYFGFFIMLLGVALAVMLGAFTSKGPDIQYINRA